MTLEEFKTLLLREDLEEILDSYVLAGESIHFPRDKVQFARKALSERYGIDEEEIQVHVVGSAKMGFALFQKVTRDGELLPSFRPFRPESDIDLAIVSPKLFEVVWDELSIHANHAPRMPWNSGLLGDYMVHGWLRPDHFPKNARLRRCDDWWDVFRDLSSDSRLGRRAISGALYYSSEHLRRYQLRGLTQCRSSLELLQ